MEGVGRLDNLESSVRRFAVDEEEAGAQQNAQHGLEAEAASSAASTLGWKWLADVGGVDSGTIARLGRAW